MFRASLIRTPRVSVGVRSPDASRYCVGVVVTEGVAEVMMLCTNVAS